MRQSWDSHETAIRQSWDSHEAVYCSTLIADFVCLLRVLVSHERLFLIVCCIEAQKSVKQRAVFYKNLYITHENEPFLCGFPIEMPQNFWNFFVGNILGYYFLVLSLSQTLNSGQGEVVRDPPIELHHYVNWVNRVTVIPNQNQNKPNIVMKQQNRRYWS